MALLMTFVRAVNRPLCHDKHTRTAGGVLIPGHTFDVIPKKGWTLHVGIQPARVSRPGT